MAKKVDFLYGVSVIEAALTANRRLFYRLHLKEGHKNPRLKPLLSLARQAGVQIQTVGADKLFSLSGSKTNQGVVLEAGPLALLDLEDLIDQTHSGGLLVALDQVEDPQNFGAILRSASFLGASGLIQTKDHAAPPSPAASKASAGALETFPVAEVGNLSESLSRLKAAGFWVLGSSLGEDTVPIAQAIQGEKRVLVLGNEGAGLRQLTTKRCDQLIQIPGSGRVESMNVSASAAILIHHLLGTDK